MRHFIRIALVTTLVALPLALTACGSSTAVDNDPFDTYEACFQEHHDVESFTVQKAIEICCIDHPIGSDAQNVVCGDTATTCETYVTANLAGSDATTTDIDAACTAYVPDRTG